MDARQALARQLLALIRDQPDNDVELLRHLAHEAKRQGFIEIADQAEEFAELFEADDNGEPL